MSQKFYTADFHIGMSDILRFEHRPFKTIDEMNYHFLKSCLERTGVSDVIIHVGDLYSFRNDRGFEGMKIRPDEFFKDVKAGIINLRGNHDPSNKVKSLCDSMRTCIGSRFPSVSVSHYPTYDKHCAGHFQPGDVHLCGHVHSKWKYCIDLDNQCLNINVGVDVWDYQLVSEEELIKYLNSLLAKDSKKLYRCKNIDGKIHFYGNPNI